MATSKKKAEKPKIKPVLAKKSETKKDEIKPLAVKKTNKTKSGNISLNFALAFLCIHLFTVNSRLLHHMNPDGITSGNVFNFMNLGTENVIAMVISISYSVMTVIIIKSLRMPFRNIWNFCIVAFFGILDAIGVGLYYMVLNNFKIWGSVYFALYTLAIIVSFGLYQSFEPVTKHDKIIEIRKLINRRRAQLGYDPEKIASDPGMSNLMDQMKTVEI
jgi:hypothetical protein